MEEKVITLDIGAKEYIENEKRLYNKYKNEWNERELISEFLLEFISVFLYANTKQRWLVKRAIQNKNGCDYNKNGMLIYDIVTGSVLVEYKKFFNEY